MPRARSFSVSVRPKPEEVPVMNQVFGSVFVQKMAKCNQPRCRRYLMEADYDRLWILCSSWFARRSALSDPNGIRTRVTAVKGRYY